MSRTKRYLLLTQVDSLVTSPSPQSNNFLPYLPPSSLVSRHAMRWMSCWEMNSLVMTSSTWLKSALCSSDRTGTDFRRLDGGDNVAQRTSTTETPISQSRSYKEKACKTCVVVPHLQQQQQAQPSQLISCKNNNRYD